MAAGNSFFARSAALHWTVLNRTRFCGQKWEPDSPDQAGLSDGRWLITEPNQQKYWREQCSRLFRIMHKLTVRPTTKVSVLDKVAGNAKGGIAPPFAVMSLIVSVVMATATPAR